MSCIEFYAETEKQSLGPEWLQVYQLVTSRSRGRQGAVFAAAALHHQRGSGHRSLAQEKIQIQNLKCLKVSAECRLLLHNRKDEKS